MAIWYMPRGCVARPGLTVQPLCEHHERKATPLAGMELIKDLRVGVIQEQARCQTSPTSHS
jgi:hypothetical protein